MPAHRVLCTYCLSCPFKAVADDTLMTSGQDPLTSGNQSSLLTFAVIHFHIITLFLPSEYVSVHNRSFISARKPSYAQKNYLCGFSDS